MEEKLIRIVTAVVGVSALLSVAALFYFPEYHVRAKEAALLREQKKMEQEAGMSGLEILDYNTANIKLEADGETFLQQLRIELPEGVKKRILFWKTVMSARRYP